MTPKSLQNTFFLLLLGLTTLAFFWVLQDFMKPVFWAIVFAILFYPIHQRLTNRLQGRNVLAAVLTLLLILVLVILPLFFVGLAVTQEALGVYERIASGELNPQALIDEIERLLPVATEYLSQFGIDLDRIKEGAATGAVSASRWFASHIVNIGENTLRITVMFFLMLYLLFFFFRDGERILNAVILALPLGDEREAELFSRFAQVSRATIKGTFVVGIVQGTLGGLIFWILGIGAPVLWGVVMTLLSLLPAIGSALVWFPTAIYLMATGSLIKGLILIAFGVLVIGLVDNFLRPLLVGRDTKMPDYLILLTTLGGLSLFGLTGFVVGPIIAALFLTFWQMFEKEFGASDDAPSIRLIATDQTDSGAPASDAATVDTPEADHSLRSD